MAFNKKRFGGKVDSSQDPQHLAIETVKTIANAYEELGIIQKGTAKNHYKSRKGKKQLVNPLAKEIERRSAECMDPEWLSKTFIRVPFSSIELRDIVNKNKFPILITDCAMDNYSEALQRVPEVPELGEIVVQSTVRLDKKFNQHTQYPENYLIKMSHQEQVNNWPELTAAIKKSTACEISHFTVSDFIPKVISTLALNPLIEINDPVNYRYIEEDPNDRPSLVSFWTPYNLYGFGTDYGTSPKTSSIGVSAVENIR